MPQTDWKKLTVRERTRRLRRIVRLKVNREMTGKQLAEKYFSNVTRGGLIVHCWRHRIRLPKVRNHRRRA